MMMIYLISILQHQVMQLENCSKKNSQFTMIFRITLNKTNLIFEGWLKQKKQEKTKIENSQQQLHQFSSSSQRFGTSQVSSYEEKKKKQNKNKEKSRSKRFKVKPEKLDNQKVSKSEQITSLFNNSIQAHNDLQFRPYEYQTEPIQQKMQQPMMPPMMPPIIPSIMPPVIPSIIPSQIQQQHQLQFGGCFIPNSHLTPDQQVYQQVHFFLIFQRLKICFEGFKKFFDQVLWNMNNSQNQFQQYMFQNQNKQDSFKNSCYQDKYEDHEKKYKKKRRSDKHRKKFKH